MWGWGRLRELPQINYNENSSSEDEDFNLPENAFKSPVGSPKQPVHTREGSPVELFHPTLNDNVDEVLEEVSIHLGDIKQVEEEIEELSSILEETKIGPVPVVKQEEVIHFKFKVAADNDLGEGNRMPDDEEAVAVNYDIENKNDGDKAADQARSIKIEFSASDIKFWFAQLEDEMLMASVGSQWLKKNCPAEESANKTKRRC